MNPLFVDSTKPVGDKVVTSIELIDILLSDEDCLYVEINGPSGGIQHYAMRAIKTKKYVRYRAEILLKYQSQVTYRFFIESLGQETLSGEVRHLRSGETVCDRWVPSSSQDKVCSETIKTKKLKMAKSIRTVPLLTKETLEQIKLFVD